MRIPSASLAPPPSYRIRTIAGFGLADKSRHRCPGLGVRSVWTIQRITATQNANVRETRAAAMLVTCYL
jgi:hypothetical protein